VTEGKEEPEQLGKDRRMWREAAARCMRLARADRMEPVFMVSSRPGRGQGYRGAERERESVWPGAYFLKSFFTIAVLRYSLHPPRGDFFS